MGWTSAQADAEGNINVSRFGPRLTAAGGFINISQSAKRLVFAGSFSAEGVRKFVRQVEQRSFSGRHAAARGQPVLYVTERCVLRLTPEGLELIELAPGLDLERDVLAQMDFRPLLPRTPVPMDAALFAPTPMGLRERLLEQRLHFDTQHGVLFVDRSRLRLRTRAEVEQLAAVLQARLEAIGQQVDGVINYEQFELDPEVANLWAQRAAELAQRHYRRVTRYGGSAFVRARLTQALALRGLPAGMVASADAALAALKN